MTTQTNEEVGL